jgi:hypothetical protein
VGILERRIIISIATAANIEIKTIIETATVLTLVSSYTINHTTLYIIRKAVIYRTTLKKNQKSLKPSLGLLIKTNLVNLITDLINNLINILWTIKMMILT